MAEITRERGEMGPVGSIVVGFLFVLVVHVLSPILLPAAGTEWAVPVAAGLALSVVILIRQRSTLTGVAPRVRATILATGAGVALTGLMRLLL